MFESITVKNIRSGYKMSISVVLPVYNEAHNLRRLYKELTSVLKSNYKVYEIIFVDDGSRDESYRIIKKLKQKDPRVKVIKLKRNFGQSTALMAGVDHAEHRYIVTMDADLQNDPNDIPRLMDKIKEGYDCVSGWRKCRKDNIGKRFPSWIQTKLAMRLGPKIHDFGCTLKIYRAGAIKDVNLYGEGHRYIPSHLHNRGYRITEIPVNHRPRVHGETKYGFFRLLKGGFDLLFNFFWSRFSMTPIHFMGSMGFIFMLFGFAIGIYRVIMKYVYGVPVLPRMAQLLLAVGLVLFGFLLFIFGIMGEILIKIYYEEKKPYVIDEMLDSTGEKK